MDGRGEGREINAQNFDKIKAHIVEMQQKRLQLLQSGQACVSAATTPDQLKACREKEHEAMEALRPERGGGGFGKEGAGEGNRGLRSGGPGEPGAN